MPDRRTRQGKRDLALRHLLGSAGLRRAEASRLLITDVDERRRASDPRLRHAIKGSTSCWAIVRYGHHPLRGAVGDPRGLGHRAGVSIMPSMAAAYATVSTADLPRATTALNVFQRVGGSVGTALSAVVLERAGSSRGRPAGRFGFG